MGNTNHQRSVDEIILDVRTARARTPVPTWAPILHGEAEKLFQEIFELRMILLPLLDADACQYDHDNLCQTHRLHERPCPHELGKAKLWAGGAQR